LDAARAGFEVGQFCPARGCQAEVIWASVRGLRQLFDAVPSPDGVYELRDVGVALPAARRLLTTQMFGKTGTLHHKHDCPQARAQKKR